MAVTFVSKAAPKCHLIESAFNTMRGLGLNKDWIDDALKTPHTVVGTKYYYKDIEMEVDSKDRLRVLSVKLSPASCFYCRDTKKQKVFNLCGSCYGKGCHKCRLGFIPATIPCQFCGVKK